ncbi:MAG: bifunctional homocysteine S-methyltransferase/methylenetetrahydrofolate reductase [Anaerolineales bacterium]|jgi:homocysteine S-methyltransferase
MTGKFLSLLESSPTPLLADGAMGTLLHSRGTPFDKCFDELNLSNPAAVCGIHAEYLEAGAQILLTNTFGANRFKLSQYGLQDKLEAINRAGVELACQAAGGLAFVAGDIGPLGVRIAPFGRVQPEQARAAFAEQAQALVKSGVDLIVIETMSDLFEIQAAIQAVHEAATGLPVIASVTFTRDDRTLLGDSPEKVARTLVKAGPDVIGVNCSGGPAQLLRLLKAMHAAVPSAKVWVKPNAGWPEQVGGRIMYPADPDYFGDYAQAFCEAGASIIGGCCGTTPEHIKAMHKALVDNPPGCGAQVLHSFETVETSEVSEVEPSSQLDKKLKEGRFIISAEMDPPRGLSTHKLIAGASLLQEAGADAINVADSPMARMRMSAWAVCDIIQRQVGVETTLHFPTRGRNLLRVQGDLLAAHALGLRNIFVVMGDPTAVGDYPEAMDNYDLVPSGLIKLIKQGFNAGVDHSGTSIGQPTSFFVGAALNLNPSQPEQEIRNAYRKVQAGVDFFLTQPIYRPEEGPQFLDKYGAKYGLLNRPVLVGILPLVSARHVSFLRNEVPGIYIPEITRRRMDDAGEDGAKVGVELAVALVTQVKSWAQGVYLMPQFSRYDLIAEIIEAVQ